jgi:hypothetical protein
MDWKNLFSSRYPLQWQMTPAERLALVGLVNAIRPARAIEVGTAQGGSLQVLADVAERVYALDVDPTVTERLARFSNVEFIVGDSARTLPKLMARLQADRTPCEFVLIDGNHAYEGVKRDINAVLQYEPLSPMYIVMHDSFNPSCRRGIRDAAWAASPYVHSVELDFIQGWYHTLADGAHIDRQMWGGLALAILSPEPRTDALVVKESQLPTFSRMYEISSHRPSWTKRARQALTRPVRRARRMLAPAV